MNYRNIEHMNATIRASLQTLPWPPEVVAGVHKSGMLAATQFASYFNVPVVSLRQLWEADWVYAGARTHLEEQDSFLAVSRRVLVVEDSVGSGGTVKKEFAMLQANARAVHEYHFLAVYGVDKIAAGFNQILEVCPSPRMFEWNWMNNTRLRRTVLDIDGVLCKDPPVNEDKNPKVYQDYVADATPLLIPDVPVMALATSRLERFRPETVDWLKKVGVQYGTLHMAPFNTATARRRHGNWKTKADVYAKLRKAILMIESSDEQALMIYRGTKKLVLAIESGIMYGAQCPQ